MCGYAAVSDGAMAEAEWFLENRPTIMSLMY